MQFETESSIRPPVEQKTSVQQISAFHLELEHLLDRVEQSSTHYQVLGADQLSTTGEIKVAYLRASVMLNPSRFGLDLSIPDDLLKRVDRAYENISQAFSILVSFQRRLEYDEALRQQQATVATVHVSKKNRRKFARFKLSIPVLVTGYENENGKWRECAQTIDLSRDGALVMLNKQVEKGKVLHLTMPMPEELRQHNHSDPRYSLYAVVRRIETPIDRRTFVALEFLGENPSQDYLALP